MRISTCAVGLTTVTALIAVIFLITVLLLSGCHSTASVDETGTQEHGSDEIDATSTNSGLTSKETVEATATEPESGVEPGTETETVQEPVTGSETTAPVTEPETTAPVTEPETTAPVTEPETTEPADEDPSEPDVNQVWEQLVQARTTTISQVSILQIADAFSSVDRDQDYAEEWDSQTVEAFLDFLGEYDISFEPADIPIEEFSEQLFYSYEIIFSTADEEVALAVAVGRNGLLYIDGEQTYHSTTAIQYIEFVQFVVLL